MNDQENIQQPSRFGNGNMSMTIDDEGIVTIRFDSKIILGKAGEANKRGKMRKADLVSTSAGFATIGSIRVCMNAVRN